MLAPRMKAEEGMGEDGEGFAQSLRSFAHPSNTVSKADERLSANGGGRGDRKERDSAPFGRAIPRTP